MDRKTFGLLITTLRKEIRNEFDQAVTQKELAEQAHLSVVTLQKIEQGRLNKLDPDVILSLGVALNLPTRARQILLTTSLGVAETVLLKQAVGPGDMLDRLVDVLTSLQSPAILADAYGDVVALNMAFLEIINLPLQEMNDLVFLSRYNFFRWLCAPEYNLQKIVAGTGYSEFVHYMILMFKMMSLKLRCQPYFLRLVPELNHLPLFRKEWQAPFIQDDEMMNILIPLSIHHPVFGVLNMLTMPQATFSRQGDLYLYNFVALDAETAKSFQAIVKKTGNRSIRLSGWPKPIV